MLRARPWEIFAKLMERARHDAIGGVEGLFDAVAMVTVDVDIENARDSAEHFEDAEDDVVDIAEPGRLALFRVVQASGPVDGDVTLTLHESLRRGCYYSVSGGARTLGCGSSTRTDGPSSGYRTELEHALESGIVVTHEELIPVVR